MAGAIVLDSLPLLAPCKCHIFKSTDNELRSNKENEDRITYHDYVKQGSVQIFLRNGDFQVDLKLNFQLNLQRTN